MRGIVWSGGKLQLVDGLGVRPPGPGEVKVKVLRSGICHSDLNMIDADMLRTPVILGHEAAGVVMETGDGVTGWAVGDPVAVGTQTPCGHCRECSRGAPRNCDETWGYSPGQPFSWNGAPVYSFSNISSFAGEIVVKTSQLFKTHGLPPEQAALIGCAVSTGFCAVRNLGQVRPGDRVAVIGIGGIGVNAIAGAQLAGAEVLAVDINPAKEDVARKAGATHFLLSNRGMDAATLSAAMRNAFEPIDIAVECSGAPVATEAAIHAVKRGGRTVLVGMTRPGAVAQFSLDAVLSGREIIAELGGGAEPSRDFPELIRLAESGQIDVGAQVTQIWPLAEFENAITALRAGTVTRAVLDHTR
jgi:S-(hydroxymethyl)glutathione dehydrogenase/alcohol dehydrogenase